MEVFICGYNFRQNEYPVSTGYSPGKTTEGVLTLDIKVTKYGEQVTPENLTKVLNDFQEFCMKYNESLN